MIRLPWNWFRYGGDLISYEGGRPPILLFYRRPWGIYFAFYGERTDIIKRVCIGPRFSRQGTEA